jgi:hypothetical protein
VNVFLPSFPSFFSLSLFFVTNCQTDFDMCKLCMSSLAFQGVAASADDIVGRQEDSGCWPLQALPGFFSAAVPEGRLVGLGLRSFAPPTQKQVDSLVKKKNEKNTMEKYNVAF